MQDPFLNIAPKKPNWDLRRDVQKKLDKLEKRTQKALHKLMCMLIVLHSVNIFLIGLYLITSHAGFFSKIWSSVDQDMSNLFKCPNCFQALMAFKSLLFKSVFDNDYSGCLLALGFWVGQIAKNVFGKLYAKTKSYYK